MLYTFIAEIISLLRIFTRQYERQIKTQNLSFSQTDKLVIDEFLLGSF